MAAKFQEVRYPASFSILLEVRCTSKMQRIEYLTERVK